MSVSSVLLYDQLSSKVLIAEVFNFLYSKFYKVSCQQNQSDDSGANFIPG
jgi:hypothetical protein